MKRIINKGIDEGHYGYSNDACLDYIDVVHRSWPWQRLNVSEQNSINGILTSFKYDETLTYEQNWDKMANIWSMCLDLLGCQPIGWRQDKNGNTIIPPYGKNYVVVEKKHIEDLKELVRKL